MMADQKVLDVQRWLNATYGGVAGYDEVDEDGNTGWATIYSLIEGLQHELGITSLAQAFGPATSAAYDEQITEKLTIGYSGNVVYLIQGAFWAKGINPVDFDGNFTENTLSAVKELQADAGFSNPDGVLNAMWAKALFDMSAFVLVSGGDSNIRQMQQYINQNYYEYTGILPADGIYQRDTNTALIYAVQAEEGLSTEVANGVFGPTTASDYQAAYNSGLSSKLILLIQYALYVNMHQFLDDAGSSSPKIVFNGIVDDNTSQIISLFQEFMKLDPVQSGEPDLMTMYSLMTSNGNPNRYFWAADTATQLTPTMVQQLVDYELNYIGRYLTGTVGAEEIPKNLTRAEVESILDAGLALIPIYQDNYPTIDYFTEAQGQSDAYQAMLAAAKLGLPAGTYIYFAVDIDAQQGDIDTNILPYFKGVQSTILSNQFNVLYHYGVYGTRNVVQNIYDFDSSILGYISNMSSGYSGNLGYAQPLNWAFDQFYEDDAGVGDVPSIDRVAASGLDEGVTTLVEPLTDIWVEKLGWSAVNKIIASGELTLDGPKKVVVNTEILKITTWLSTESSIGDSENTVSFNVTNGEIEAKFGENVKLVFGDEATNLAINGINSLFSEFDDGKITLDGSYVDGVIDVTVDLVYFETKDSIVEESSHLNFEIIVDLNIDDDSDALHDAEVSFIDKVKNLGNDQENISWSTAGILVLAAVVTLADWPGDLAAGAATVLEFLEYLFGKVAV
ncbi:MAG TPA: glycoside hydrolase domain-containing protein [Lactobacillaceae bacterium]